MSDPLMKRRDDLAGTLFEQLGEPRPRSTRDEAHIAAMRDAERRREQILTLLRERGPMTCFELAQVIGVQDHSVSGRLTELKTDALIEPTGERRVNPRSGRKVDVYRIARGAQ